MSLGRRVRRWSISMVLATGCGGSAPAEEAATSAATQTAAPDPHRDGPTAGVASEPDDCDELAALAGADRLDAYALWELCRAQVTGQRTQRAVLLNVRNPAEVARLTADLSLEPELAGLARLVALDLGPPSPGPLPPVGTFLALPIDDAVLGTLARAWQVAEDPDAPGDERTRAEALLALAHLQAFEGLGLDPREPLPPLARWLGLMTLRHGQRFCLRYIRNHVAGVYPTFVQIESALLDLRIALTQSPTADDPGLAAVVLPDVDWYLALDSVRARLKKREVAGREGRRLDELPTAADRAVRSVQRHNLAAAASAIRTALDDPDTDPSALSRRIDAAIVEAGLERHASAFVSQTDRRVRKELERRAAAQAAIEAARRAKAAEDTGTGGEAPPTEAPPPAPAMDDEPPAWASAAEVALEVERALTDPSVSGFRRDYRNARAKRRLTERPDALLVLLARAHELPELAPALPGLIALLEAEHLRTARALDVLHEVVPSADVDRRRRADFAARTRTSPGPRASR